jgi:hypothetical protein
MPSRVTVETGVIPTESAPLRRRDGLLFLSTSPSFILALALLLLNDWILKDAFGNWVTGKLSDFAGLFAFALFWGALMPKHRHAAMGLIAVAFMAWKSPLSTGALAAWNAVGILPLARVVDYTDWLALSVLFPASRLLDHALARGGRPAPTRHSPTLARRIAAVATAAIAMAAFMATSVAAPTYPVADHEGYLLPGGKSEARIELDSLGFYISEWPVSSDTSTVDSLMVWVDLTPERDAGVRFELRAVSPDESRITPFEFTAWGSKPQAEAIDEAFEEQIIVPLRERLTRPASLDPLSSPAAASSAVARMVK